MGLKIDLYCNDGSPIGLIPADIYGRGVGGAELAMMSWAETMAARGHQVRIYNSPSQPGDHDGVEYLPQDSFAPQENRDAFILFRSPSPHLRATKANIKIHWSCDQFTVGHFGRDIFPWVDKVICISPYHVDYHKRAYQVENGKIDYIDLGVRLEDYNQEVEKIPGRCIFCSVPDRGLEILRMMWPKIKRDAPHASLVITADYRLWGAPGPRNHQHRMSWLHQEDVVFLGAIPRRELVREQLAAQVHSFPCTYEELFCISAAECQVAGALPVTSNIGALETTNKYAAISGNPFQGSWQEKFINVLIWQIEENGVSDKERAWVQKQARERFDWQVICGKWEGLIRTGEILNNP